MAGYITDSEFCWHGPAADKAQTTSPPTTGAYWHGERATVERCLPSWPLRDQPTRLPVQQQFLVRARGVAAWDSARAVAADPCPPAEPRLPGEGARTARSRHSDPSGGTALFCATGWDREPDLWASRTSRRTPPWTRPNSAPIMILPERRGPDAPRRRFASEASDTGTTRCPNLHRLCPAR